MIKARTKYEVQLDQLATLENKKRNDARTNLSRFVRFTFDGYDMQWFHKIVCDYLDKLYNGEIKKLMIFIPPQHGKSELSSRRYPAYVLGREPKTKIAVCSYSADLSSSFNRAVQMIIDSPEYIELFPDTQLNSKRVSTETKNGVLRNSTIFEVVEHRGFMKTVGVGGSLTGTPVDLGIIDDPFKDRMEANSKTYRNRVWDWYNDVFCTRMHNDSKQLMLFTRWHEDDLAGRLLDPNNDFYDEKEANEWTVIAMPALKEVTKPLECALDIKDPRKIGDALWESRHSRAKYEKRKRTNPTGFASLDQQRPSPQGGDMIREEWFTIMRSSELPFNIDRVTWDAWIDGAWTKKQSNDETAISWTYFDKANKILYIRGIYGVRKELDKLMQFLPSNASVNGATNSSQFHIEMKASGAAIKVLLRNQGYNTVRITNDHVKIGKYNRVEQCEPFLAGGRVVLIQGNWIPSFIAQCTAFPNGAHDDKVDVLTYPILKYFLTRGKAKTTVR